MKKLAGISLFIFFCAVTAVLTAGLVFYQGKSNLNNKTSINVPILSAGTILNIDEISKHNTNADCWIIVNNKVYNISDYASSHPGGVRNILNYCGKESTQAFNTKGGQGNPHSASANSMLTQYYVGDLNQKISSNTVSTKTTTSQNNNSNVVVPINNLDTTKSNLISSGITSLNLAEISKHNTDTDCWIIVNSKVYNISNYASSHPGGSRNILNNCGKESTQAFNTKGGQGNTHSTYANDLLAQYFIGNLNQNIDQQVIQQTIQKIQSNPAPVNNRSGDDD